MHIKRDSCNGKRTASTEAETPRKSLRIYRWAENQEACGGVAVKVWLTESTCCLDNLNIQGKRKEGKNMAAVEALNRRAGGAKVKIRASSQQQGWQQTRTRPPKMCLIWERGKQGVTVIILNVRGRFDACHAD